MGKHRDLDPGQALPAWWTDALQEYIGAAALNLRVEAVTPANTSLRVVAGPGADLVAVGFGGPWRYITSTITAAHPGGAPGEYDVFLTASANDFTGTPPNVDQTDYAFAMTILASGGLPGTALYRKVATLTWDGSKITDVRQTVGSATLVKHGTQHDPGGSDPITITAVGAAITTRGTFAGRPAASAANAGLLYFATDTQVLYRSVDQGGGTYAWETWGGLGVGKAVATIGNGSATQIDVAHNLGTRDVLVSVREAASPYTHAFPDVQSLDANTVRLTFAVAPSSGQYVVTVIGGNAQAVAAHAGTHASGGGDPISPASIGAADLVHAARHHPQTGADKITMSLSGTLAARPAASAVADGTIYVATDEAGGTAYQERADAWARLAPTGQVDYVQATGDITISSTSPATPNDVLNGTSQAYEAGNYWVEFQGLIWIQDVNHRMHLDVWDGATRLGEIFRTNGGETMQYVKTRIALTAATHQIRIRGYVLTPNDAVRAGDGTAGNPTPAYLRVTRA